MNTEPQTEKYHHPFGPSKLSALEFCPCYEARTGTHIKAAIGTMQHKVTETGEDDFRLSDDEATAAAECLDFVEKKKTELEEKRLQAISELAKGMEDVASACKLAPGNVEQNEASIDKRFPPVLEISEIYLPVDGIELLWRNKGHSGTTGGWLDTVLLSHDRRLAIAFDWKFGRWAVEAAENNIQGICYALGLFLAYPTVDTVRFFFKQPHIKVLTSATFTRADVPRLYTRVLAVVHRAMEAQRGETPNWDMAKPGYPVCMFCNRLGTCPKIAQMALHVSKKFWPTGVPADVTPNSVIAPDMARARMQLAGILQVWCKAVRKQESERSLRGGQIPEGYRLEQKTPRVIADPVQFKKVALTYLTPEEFDSTLEYEFGKVEKLVKDKTPRGQKENALEALDQSWREAGAVKDGQTYTYLTAVDGDETNNKQ